MRGSRPRASSASAPCREYIGGNCRFEKLRGHDEGLNLAMLLNRYRPIACSLQQLAKALPGAGRRELFHIGVPVNLIFSTLFPNGKIVDDDNYGGHNERHWAMRAHIPLALLLQAEAPNRP